MKNLAGKLKGLNYKQVGIDHGEKFVVGLIGLLILFALIGTPIARYGRAPGEFTEKVEEGTENLAASEWPDEKRIEIESAKDVSLGVNEMLAGINVAPFEYTTEIIKPLYPKKEKIKEPEWVAVEQLIADTGRVILSFPPEIASTPGMMGDGTDVDGIDGVNGTAGPASDTAPIGENAPRRGGARGLGMGPGGMPGGLPGDMAGGLPGGVPGGLPGGTATAEMYGMPGAESAGDVAGMGEGMMGMMGGGMAAKVFGKGLRYTAIRGVFPLKQQTEKIAKALNISVQSRATAYIEFLDFVLERQTAVAGPDPWAGSWDQVDIQAAVDLLKNVNYEPDVVEASYTDAVFTMPLPARVAGAWGKKATHPLIKELSEEEIEQQRVLNEKTIEAYKTTAASQRVTKGGFAPAQFDLKEARSAVFGSDMAGSVMSAAMSDYAAGMGDAGGYETTGGSMNSGMGGYMSRMMGMGGMGMPGDMAGMGDVAGMGGMPGGRMMVSRTGAAIKYLLFRYYDFDVEPGNAYRYRVKLRLRNPNHNRAIEDLVDPEIRKQETRDTPFSKPSNVALIENDSEYFVTKITEPRGTREANANIEVFQWYPESGTQINGELKSVEAGEFIAGVQKATVLRPEESLKEEEEVKFNTGDVLIDIANDPVLTSDEYPQLSFGRTGFPFSDEMLVMNKFGELVVVDNTAHENEMARAKNRLKAERDPWSFLERKATTGMGGMPGGDGTGELGDMYMEQMMMMNSGGMGSAGDAGGAGGRRGRSPRWRRNAAKRQ